MSVSTTLSNQSSNVPPRMFTAAEASDNQYMMNLNDQSEKQSLQWGEYPQYKLIPIPSYNMSNPGVNNSLKVNNCPSANEQVTYNPPNYFEATCDRHINNFPHHNNVVVGHPHNGHNVTSLMRPAGVRNRSDPRTAANSSWMNQIRTSDRFSRPAVWSSNIKPSSGGVRKPKRIRTAFTSQQMLVLEEEYAKTRYLDRSRRIELSDTLQLNERTIKIWFQNRRMKEKKDRAESLDESEASTTESSPDMGPGNMIHMCDQYTSTPAINPVINRPNMYVEHHSNAVPTIMLPHACVSMSEASQNVFVNPYQTYTYDNSHHASVQLEPLPPAMQFQAVNSGTTIEPVPECKDEVLPDSSTNIVESKQEPFKIEIDEQKWDFSWLRSVKIEEEF